MDPPKPKPPAELASSGLDSPESTRAWDYVVIVIVSAGCLLLVVGNIILIRFRKWHPIRTKGVLLTSLSSLGGFVWVVSTVVVLRHFPRKQGTIFASCWLWTFWLWACFGFGLWLNCLTVRMMQLYLVFVRKMVLRKRELLKRTVLPLLVLLSPAIILALVATRFQALRYVSETEDCSFRPRNYISKFGIPILCLIPLYFLIFLWFAFQLRNIMSQWNEFRQIRIGGIMSFFLFLLSLVTILSKVRYQVAGRCFLTLVVAGAVFYYFWARNWDVVYHVLFNKANYEQQFGHELNRFNETRRTMEFETNPMERLVVATKEEASQLFQEIEQLQAEINLLKLQPGRDDISPAAV